MVTARGGWPARTSALIAATLVCSALWGDVVTLVPTKDNTLYEDAGGALGNGVGQYFFAGRSGVTTNNIRRAVLAFDVAGSVPAGATIDSVTLTLHMSMAPFTATAGPYRLRPVLSDWGEGSSDAQFQEGGGTTAAVADATWLHTFFDTQRWNSAGGDFASTVSAEQQVGGVVGFYTWGPTSAMQADVQSWLDDPASNFGWILTGNEGQLQTARRFDSVQNPELRFRPALTIEFHVTTAGGVGRVPDGATIPGTPLTAVRGEGDTLQLSWGATCGVADDYEVYEGVVGDWASHLPATCSTGGVTFATLAPMVGDTYYLVVPRSDAAEGSYGTNAAATERPASSAACLVQSVADCP